MSPQQHKRLTSETSGERNALSERRERMSVTPLLSNMLFDSSPGIDPGSILPQTFRYLCMRTHRDDIMCVRVHVCVGLLEARAQRTQDVGFCYSSCSFDGSRARET